MSNRAAKFVSAIFASLLAGAPLTTVSYSAADDCLSGPKDETPEGSHWYYRIDRATKRHCWYLREQIGKPLQITAPISPPSVKPVSPKAEATPQRSIANARAELPPQTLGQSCRACELNLANTTAIGSRCRPIRGSRPVVANLLSPCRTGAVGRADGGTGARWHHRKRHSQTRRPTAPSTDQASVRRDTIWEPTDDDRIVLSAPPGADILPRRTGFARDRTRDRDDRIAEFFSQLSRRAPT
jgi:hypothetical protein